MIPLGSSVVDSFFKELEEVLTAEALLGVVWARIAPSRCCVHVDPGQDVLKVRVIQVIALIAAGT